jgi:hypothetical protein
MKIFTPALLKMIDEKIKTYHVGDFIIQCEEANQVQYYGYKISTLKIIGKKYIIRVFMDNEYKQGVALCLDHTADKNEANKIFKQKFEMCKNCMM